MNQENDRSINKNVTKLNKDGQADFKLTQKKNEEVANETPLVKDNHEMQIKKYLLFSEEYISEQSEPGTDHKIYE